MLKITKKENDYLVELFQLTRLNTLVSDLVKKQLQELVDEPGTSVIFNLEGIRFIDTSGFDVLKDISQRAGQAGSRFRLCNVSDDVKELIRLLELEDALSICTCENIEEKILMVLD